MSTTTADTPQVLLEHHLKALRLPTMLRETGAPTDRSSPVGWEYDKQARTCAVEKANFPNYLLRLTELELLDRDRRATALVGELIEARDEKRLLRFLSRFDG